MRSAAQKLAERLCGELAPDGANTLLINFSDDSVLKMTWISAPAEEATRH